MKELEKIVDSNGEPLEIVDAEAREDISEIKQSLSDLTTFEKTARADISEIKQSLSDFETLEKTASGAIATFDDGSDLPMPSLKVSIEPVQSGSGDPSPSNVRPISGWTKANVTVADDVETPTVSNVYTIDLDGTRYGGEVDVVNGTMTVDRAIEDLGALNYTKFNVAEGTLFRTSVSGAKLTYNVNNIICSAYKYSSKEARTNGTFSIPDTKNIDFINDSYTTESDFKTAMNGVQLVYELKTPLEIQLTPTQVKSLLGDNNVWADTGNIELTYLTNNPLTQTVYDMVKILVEQST